MAGQKRKVGIKAIKKALTECACCPDRNPWFRIAAEADNNYLLRRSDELLRQVIGSQAMLGVDPKLCLQQAIALLGLVKVRFNERVQA